MVEHLLTHILKMADSIERSAECKEHCRMGETGNSLAHGKIVASQNVTQKSKEKIHRKEPHKSNKIVLYGSKKGKHFRQQPYDSSLCKSYKIVHDNIFYCKERLTTNEAVCRIYTFTFCGNGIYIKCT